jgi:hypothetical protein
MLLLFRIEDINGTNPRQREYASEKFIFPSVEKMQIDQYIAGKIRDEVNCSNRRELLSYSKSLAICSLKYNEFADNELHIYDNYISLNYISYISHKRKHKLKRYSLAERLQGKTLFYKSGPIQLRSFVIDISNNALLDQYLSQYTDSGLKQYASPEKDCEVVVMNPANDLTISRYIDAVYVLYALQYKYNFLNNYNVKKALICELRKMADIRFEGCPKERDALIKLVSYLSSYWLYEKKISQKTYITSSSKEHQSMWYDPIWQFNDIISLDFMDSYNRRDNYETVVACLFWEYCRKSIERQE